MLPCPVSATIVNRLAMFALRGFGPGARFGDGAASASFAPFPEGEALVPAPVPFFGPKISFNLPNMKPPSRAEPSDSRGGRPPRPGGRPASRRHRSILPGALGHRQGRMLATTSRHLGVLPA